MPGYANRKSDPPQKRVSVGSTPSPGTSAKFDGIEYNRRRAALLGMPLGTAMNKLRKAIMFSLVARLGLDTCHHCGKKIATVDEFSIEHKTPWQSASDPRLTFFDQDNIGFSHHSCNVRAAKRTKTDGHSYARYQRGCRCAVCTEENAKMRARYREKKKARLGLSRRPD